ncbi:hypothetical protein JJL45_05245 [Tamlana sp. s12]|uniref:hypothetical protein n=1 Tax=Tamlana sp. s12 TaxID=1630406 RepID=UPI0008021E65|nr:hypothetical protein [Tamlana sp. s12]OBQ56090.1 hypothetical protein VQ01_06815 [Tamlana sp. s12]QQY83397.1 hypothetical protein JJL45_05245 [Tamlana sp. s12]
MKSLLIYLAVIFSAIFISKNIEPKKNEKPINRITVSDTLYLSKIPLKKMKLEGLKSEVFLLQKETEYKLDKIEEK